MRLSNSQKCSGHPLQTLATIQKMRLIFPAGLGETKTCWCQRLVVSAHTIYGLQSCGGNGWGQHRPLYCLQLASELCFGHHRDNGFGRTFLWSHWIAEMITRNNKCKKKMVPGISIIPSPQQSQQGPPPSITHDY